MTIRVRLFGALPQNSQIDRGFEGKQSFCPKSQVALVTRSWTRSNASRSVAPCQLPRLGDLAPPLYYYVKKMNERDRQISDICCSSKMGCCSDFPPDSGNPNNPDPSSPTNPGSLGYPGTGRGGNPVHRAGKINNVLS